MFFKRLFIPSLLFLFCASVLFAGRDYFDDFLKMPDGQKSSFIQSLKPEEVWKIASQAYEKGWDDYGVSVGILSKAFGQNWERHRPSCEELIAIVKDPAFHNGLRGATAAGGMELSSTWNDDDFLRFVDVVLLFFQTKDIPYKWKWKIPDYLQRATQRKIESSLHDKKTSPETTALVDQLHARSSVLMESIATLVTNTPKSDSSLGDIVIAASKYSGFYLSKTFPPSSNRDAAIRNAYRNREILVSILDDSSYSSSVGRGVLRNAQAMKLWEVLSSKTVTKLESDKRFSDSDSTAVLHKLEQKIKTNPNTQTGVVSRQSTNEMGK